MTEKQKRTVEEFIKDLEKYSFDGDAVSADINLLLEAITHALDGKLHYYICSDKYTKHRKIVIEYEFARKE